MPRLQSCCGARCSVKYVRQSRSMCTTTRRMTVTLLLLLAVLSCGSALPPPPQGGKLSPPQTLDNAPSISTVQASSNESAAETEDVSKSYPGAAEIVQLPVHEQQEQVQLERREEFSREESVADSSEELEGNSKPAEASLQNENVIKVAEPEPGKTAVTADDYNDDSDMFLEPEEEEEPEESKTAMQQSSEQSPETINAVNMREVDAAGMAQHFFPAFAPLFPGPPPLGHSRPSLFQEPAQSHRSPLRSQQNGFQPLSFGTAFRENAYFHNPVTSETKSNNLLGSGNFGVIRGGTFYDEDDRDYGGRGGIYSSYQNNGHGRPAFHGNPRPQHGNDFFSNFRDFADINTPKSSFSEYVVVYVNKNASREDGNDEQKVLASGNFKPKNIIEQLRMLDGEAQEKYAVPASMYAVPSPDPYQEKLSRKTGSSLSPAKQKLALYQEKFNKNKKSKKITSTVPKDLYEPLLALS